MRQLSDRRFVFLLFLLGGFACVIPDVMMPGTDPIRTAAAQTVIADLTQAISEPGASAQPASTSTVVVVSPTWTPSLTPTITLTATPVFTPTALIPQITVSVDTNCRIGPGRVYPRVGALLVGEIAEVYGRDPTGRYWYIRNPDKADGYCWVWGEYAILTGAYLYLPVFTPPPTPTPTFTPTVTITPTLQPNFTLAYQGSDFCSGWWMEVRVRNSSSVTFRSMEFDIRDLVAGQKLIALSDGFANVDGCSAITTKDILAPGDEFVISSPIFPYDPTGNEMAVHLTLCSQPSQKGDCVKRNIKFTP